MRTSRQPQPPREEENDPAELLRAFDQNRITLEEYVIRGGPNIYSTGGWSFGFSPKYHEQKELERKFDQYANTVRAYTTVDQEAERNRAILNQHEEVINRILSTEIPAVVSKIKSRSESNVQEAYASVLANTDVGALRYKFNNATHLRNASALIVRRCQERSAMLRDQATQLHKKLTLSSILDATDEVLKTNAKALGTITRKEERKQAARENVEAEHEGIMNYYTGIDEQQMMFTEPSETADAFQAAILQAMRSVPSVRVAAHKPSAITTSVPII